MNIVKLRLLLHFARKQKLALLMQALKGATVLAAIPFFIYVTLYNTTHDVAFHNFGANLGVGVFFTTALIFCAIAVVMEWCEALEKLTTPYARQAWVRPYAYFMHSLTADRKQPTLF